MSVRRTRAPRCLPSSQIQKPSEATRISDSDRSNERDDKAKNRRRRDQSRYTARFAWGLVQMRVTRALRCQQPSSQIEDRSEAPRISGSAGQATRPNIVATEKIVKYFTIRTVLGIGTGNSSAVVSVVPSDRRSKGSSQGRHYRESLFWTVRSFESRTGHRAPPWGACDHGRPRAAPRQINARSWERHFQRRDAIFVIALLERLQHITYLTAPNAYNTPLPRGPLVS